MRALTVFWLPLALSWMMMIVAQPLTAIAIGRLADPAIHLAAYGIAFDLAFLLESPIIMLLSVSVALTRDQASYRLLRRVTLWISGVMTGLFAVVAFTPAYGPLVRGLIGVPEEVAAQVRPALQLLLPWIGAIAWRRFHQGPLITAGLTRLVSYGTLIRLATLGAVLGAGVAWPALPGATLGGLALSASVVVEAAVNTHWARPVIRRLPSGGPTVLTIPDVLRFCAPLAATDIMRTVVRPAITAGVARAALPAVSLAAWPVAASLIMLISSATMAFQEVSVALIEDRGSFRQVRRFILTVGLLIMCSTVIIVMTPLIDAGLIGLVRLPDPLRPHVVQGLRIMVPLPMLLALRNLYRGVLIRSMSTTPIQCAMMVHVLVMIVMLAAGVRAGWTGIPVAATATLAAAVAEALVLYAFYRRAVQDLA
jgi:hypothetical protein